MAHIKKNNSSQIVGDVISQRPIAMRVQILTSFSAIRSLACEWNDLLRRSGADTVFLRWEWVESWLDALNKPVRPFVITVRHSHGELVGLAPLYIAEFRLLKMLTYRVLRLMGDIGTGAEYPDWIVDQEYATSVRRNIATTLTTCHRSWDCIWLPKVAGWTDSYNGLVSALQSSGFYFHVRPVWFSSFDLPESMSIYFKTLSRSQRSQLRRQTKNILGSDEVSITRCKAVSDLSRYLNALFELHGLRWQRRDEQGTFCRHPLTKSFYKDFAVKAINKGWLRLFALEDKGCIKAVQIGYVYNDVFYQLQEGYDPDYVSGVGNVLRYKVIEACIAEEIKTYDFMNGGEGHKKRWSASERMGYDIFVGHRNSYKTSLIFTREIWPSGKYLSH